MKIFNVAIIILLVLFISGVVYGAATSNVTPANTNKAVQKGSSDALQHKPGVKIERGFKNLLFGWTEIPRSIIQVTKDSRNPIWGITGGTLQGIGKAFPRTVSGAADIVSFPIADYDKAPISPDELKTQIK